MGWSVGPNLVLADTPLQDTAIVERGHNTLKQCNVQLEWEVLDEANVSFNWVFPAILRRLMDGYSRLNRTSLVLLAHSWAISGQYLGN